MDWDQFTQQGMAVIASAKAEARRLNDSALTSEHILLGLLRRRNSVAVRLIQETSVTREELREAIEARIKPGTPDPAGNIKLSGSGKQILALAVDEARQAGDEFIGSEHLLLALAREQRVPAGQVLTEKGLTLDRLRKSLREVLAIA